MQTPDELLAHMTLEEKAALLTGDSVWTTTAIPRIGLATLRMADGPHGVRRTQSDSMAFAAQPATCFPTASCTGGSWNPDLLYEVARAIAEEAIALDVDVVLGPGVNIKRSPLCGRNFEYFSEDPYLTGELATAWIEGIQSLGVGASLKHFAVNNQETRRMSVSAEVDERSLREIYLPAFETAVKRARPWTVMCAYNRINGVYASEHHELLTRVLRDEWGFEGFVVSDWAAVHDRPAALAAGLDLEMPGPRPRRVQAVIDAVRNGSVAESVLDEAALRILRIIVRARQTPKGRPFDANAHHALARRAAAEGMVLLKNDGILPLANVARIAVIGRAAREPRIQGGGSSQTTPTAIDDPFDKLSRLAGEATVEYAAGHSDVDEDQTRLRDEAVALASRSDVAIVYLAMPAHKESEGSDRADLDFTPDQVDLMSAVANAQPHTVAVLFNGSAVNLTPFVETVAAILEAWYAGQAAGGAVADILFGVVNPSGRLAETFPLRLEDTPAYLNFPGEGDVVRYGEGTFVGYRWYDSRRQQVLFPFGHGLSYTDFAYGAARATPDAFGADEDTTISVDVTNTGSRAGAEVVQVYVRPPRASNWRPAKELKGFAKVYLEPGETRSVEIKLKSRAFASWDVGRHDWVVAPGRHELLVGSSSAAIHAVVLVTIRQTSPRSTALTAMSPLDDWLHDPAGQPAALGLMRDLAPILGGVFDDVAKDPSKLGPHFHSYFGTMPLRGLLEFAAPAGGPEPESRLADLLRSVAEDGQPRQLAGTGSG